MDIYIGNYRFSTYFFLLLAAMEANSLMNTAVAVSAFSFKRCTYTYKISGGSKKTLRTNNYFLLKSSASNEECQHYIRNLIEERNNLKIQDRMLRTGESVVAASVKNISRE